jgi:hypothetical protein
MFLKKNKNHKNFMYKLSKYINKSIIFNEFMKKIDLSNIPRY